MRYVTKFLITLLFVFYLSFCSFGVGAAYADSGSAGSSSGSYDHFIRVVIPSEFSYVDSSKSTVSSSFQSVTWSPNYGANLGSSLVSSFGLFRAAYTNYFKSDFLYGFGGLSLPFSYNFSLGNLFKSGSFSWTPDFKLFSGYYSNSAGIYDYRNLPSYISGSATVNFSDGSSRIVNFSSHFGSVNLFFEKDDRSNQYLLSSEDFNLKSDIAKLSSKNTGLTSKAAGLVTKNASYVSRKASFNTDTFQMSSDNAGLSGSDVSIYSSDTTFRSGSRSSANLGLGDLTISSSSASISSNSSNNNSLSANGGTKTIGSVVTPDNAVTSKSAINSAIRSFSLSAFSFSLSNANVSFVSKAVINYLTSFYFSGGYLSFTDGRLSVSGGSFSAIDGSANFSGGSLFASDGELTANAGQFGLADGDFSASDSDFDISEKGVINEAPVTLETASSDVYITSISLSGTIEIPLSLFEEPVDYNNLPFSFAAETSGGNRFLYFAFNPYAVFSSNENVLVRISSTLDLIYRNLRYDLPLTLRHLIIPTTEEVSDVVEEAVEDIKNNAGGLGQAVGAVEDDLKQFQQILSGGESGSLKIPAAVVNVSGQSYTLWEEFDVSPYFQLKPIQDIVSYVVPFLEFLVASFVIYQLYYMWISILSGNSYFAYLKNIPSLNSEEGE